MRKLKKLLSILLCCLLVAGSVPVAVAAEEDGGIDETDFTGGSFGTNDEENEETNDEENEETNDEENEETNGGESDEANSSSNSGSNGGTALESAKIKSASDVTAPSLSYVDSPVYRTDQTTAAVQFISDEAGSYYYEVVYEGAAAPDIDTDGEGTVCDTSVQTISLTGLTAGRKDVYIVVKDAAGNISEPLIVEVEAYALQNLMDAMKALTDSTETPADFDYELGSENIVYTHEGYMFYAKLLKMEIKADSILDVSFYGKNESIDTCLWLLKKEGSDITVVEYYDEDKRNNFGEMSRFFLEEEATYYLALASYNMNCTGLCHAEISVTEVSNAVYGSLDFTAESIPTPNEGDKWSWDESEKTLTLKDGFALFADEDETAIILPDGATVVIEGTAQITSKGYDGDGIRGKGTLTVKGSGVEDSGLTIFANDTGIANDGDMLVEDCSLIIRTIYFEGIYSIGNMTIRSAALDIFSDEEGLYVSGEGKKLYIEDSNVRIVAEEEGIENYGDVIITDSNVRIVADDEGIQNYGDVIITDSNINIDATSDEEGIDAGSGDIIVSGGRLIIAADEDALEANKISLTDVFFDLKTVDTDYNFLDMNDSEGFALPGFFRLYDAEGKMLYEGEWKEDLLSDKKLYVEGVEVFHAVSVHGHVWSDKWESDATHHWHECGNSYCDITENKDKAGYAAHEAKIMNAVEATETKDGYTGDTVCSICGYEMAKGKVIPATGPLDGSAKPAAPSSPAGSPSTGDDSNLFMWLVLLMISFGSMIGIVVYRGKRN